MFLLTINLLWDPLYCSYYFYASSVTQKSSWALFSPHPSFWSFWQNNLSASLNLVSFDNCELRSQNYDSWKLSGLSLFIGTLPSQSSAKQPYSFPLSTLTPTQTIPAQTECKFLRWTAVGFPSFGSQTSKKWSFHPSNEKQQKIRLSHDNPDNNYIYYYSSDTLILKNLLNLKLLI